VTVSSLFGPHRLSLSSSRQTNPDNKAPQGPRRPRLSSFRCNCQIAGKPRRKPEFCGKAANRDDRNRPAPASQQGGALLEFVPKSRRRAGRHSATAVGPADICGRVLGVKLFLQKSRNSRCGGGGGGGASLGIIGVIGRSRQPARRTTAMVLAEKRQLTRCAVAAAPVLRGPPGREQRASEQERT
jgi:hypothetical protein